jgi:hypothetical protein
MRVCDHSLLGARGQFVGAIWSYFGGGGPGQFRKWSMITGCGMLGGMDWPNRPVSWLGSERDYCADSAFGPINEDEHCSWFRPVSSLVHQVH